MQRYRLYGQEDDQPLSVGDEHFLGVDEYNNPENVQPAYVQSAVNQTFSTMNAETRGGFVCLPELGNAPFAPVWAGSPVTITDSQWYCIAYGFNKFVSGGKHVAAPGVVRPAIKYSTDGKVWTQVIVDGASNDIIYSIVYSNGRFIAGAQSAIYYSTDAITWTKSASSVPGNKVSGIIYGNGRLVAVCGDPVIGFGFFYAGVSTDNGTTWTFGPNLTSQFLNPNDLTFWNGTFFVVTNGSEIVTSPDGVTWTKRATISTSGGGLISIAYGNGSLVSISGYEIWICNDLINFTSWSRSYLANPITGENFHDIDFYNGRFYVVCTTTKNLIFTSINGTGWISYDTGISVTSSYPAIQSMANGNNISVVVNAYDFGPPYNLECIYSTNSLLLQNVWASNIYSDPDEIGTNWIMMLGANSVGFYAFGHTSRQVSLGSYVVSSQSTIVQANNYVYIFRGDDATPLYWNGDWNTSFAPVPATTLPATYNSIPNSNQATYYQNRLWIRDGKDSIAASDVLAFTDYDPLANEFNLNTGNSDYVVATFPFGQNSLVCFKNKSIELMQNVEGSLSDVTVTEITRQVGLVGINAVTSVGPDLAYVSYGNINLLTLTSTNNSLQHKTMPLSSRIRRIMNRVNWNVGYKISIGYWNNKLYVSLPLDNSLFCNAVVVYNFITESWYGEWNFSPDMNMCVQGWAVNDYLGLQRLHAITEDGRIFVTDEGQNDISGTTVSEISTELVTRAYSIMEGDNERRGMSVNSFQRRMFADVSTNRASFSITSYTDGANEESSLLTNEAYTRSQSWLFNDSAYDLTNANNDYNRPYRRDYSTGPVSVQSGTGFEPEMRQDIRIPLITRRQGRLSWLKLTNSKGYLMLKSIGFESRAGQRSSYIQA